MLSTLCASLKDLAFIASAICRAAASSASGSATMQTLITSSQPRLQVMPSSSSGSQDSTTCDRISSQVRPITASAPAISHLPVTISQARAGCAISTSIERRSRSPAVLSTAADMPQKKAGKNSMLSMLPIRPAEREALVPVS